MTTLSYPMYENVHPFSRRQSMSYGSPTMSYPYDRSQYYPSPMMQYPQPSYQIYAQQPSIAFPGSQRLTGPSYDDLSLHDSYYDRRRMSTSSLIPGGRRRRHSSLSVFGRSHSRLPGTLQIKFRRKGSLTAGISLMEAQSGIRLSNNNSYSLHDLHADRHDSIWLKVEWTGYSSMIFEVPLDTYDGRISLSTLARRISRACITYLQSRAVPLPWERVELHHIEEVAYGTWQAMLTVR